jgi:hypothetical protein
MSLVDCAGVARHEAGLDALQGVAEWLLGHCDSPWDLDHVVALLSWIVARISMSCSGVYSFGRLGWMALIALVRARVSQRHRRCLTPALLFQSSVWFPRCCGNAAYLRIVANMMLDTLEEPGNDVDVGVTWTVVCLLLRTMDLEAVWPRLGNVLLVHPTLVQGMWAAAPTFSGVLLLSCERCRDNHLVHRVFVSVWRLGLLRPAPLDWVVFLAHRRLLTGALGQEVMADFLEHGHRHPVRVFDMYQEWSLHHAAVLCRVLKCPPELVQHVALPVFSHTCTMHTIVSMGPGALDLFLELCCVHWDALELTCLGKALLSANPADFPAAVAGVQKTVLLRGFYSIMSILPTLFRLIMREEWTFEV